MNDINLKDLDISDHFISRCGERAPWLTKARKKKDGGGIVLVEEDLQTVLSLSKEIERPKTITRLIKYGYRPNIIIMI